MKSETYEAVNEWNDCREEALVTPRMVHERTVAMAVAAGRSELEISQRDYEMAKLEVTGEVDPDRQMNVLYPGYWRPNMLDVR